MILFLFPPILILGLLAIVFPRTIGFLVWFVIKMIAIAALAIIGYAVYTAANADPYASSQRDLVEHEFQIVADNFREEAVNIYYAEACSVFPQHTNAGAILGPEATAIIETWHPKLVPLRIDESNLVNLVDSIDDGHGPQPKPLKRAGYDRAKTQGCQYWHDHPELVRAIRRELGR